MATLKLCIVPAKVLINGKHKVRISLAHNSGTRYIPTNCIIDDLSQFKDGQVVNHPEAASMNMKLRNLLNHYQKVIDNIYDVDVYSCSELREIIIKKKDHTNAKFSSAMNSYLNSQKRKEVNQRSYIGYPASPSLSHKVTYYFL